MFRFAIYDGNNPNVIRRQLHRRKVWKEEILVRCSIYLETKEPGG